MNTINNETTIEKTKSFPLLDSSLITATKCFDKRVNSPQKNYKYKIIDCGDYLEIYEFDFERVKKDNNWDNFDFKKIDTDNLTKKSKPMLHEIELKNIIRSKLECQRIAKTNIDKWNSFITLTFADNITDLFTANKIFHTWCSCIRRVKPDFMYLAVPEFQKRGAVHYHILSNLSLSDTNLIIPQEGSEDYYDVNYWASGFSAFDDVSGDIKKIIGYIAKYMTKDADSRLYGHRRYLHSSNVSKPVVQYLDSEDFSNYYNLIDYNLDYNNTYLDIYTKTDVNYMEFKRK